MDLMSFGPRHFIFMLINSDMSQMEEIVLKGYDIQGLFYDSYPLKVYSIECFKLRIRQGGK